MTRFVVFFVVIFFVSSIIFADTLDEIKKKAVQSTHKNEVIMPNLPKNENDISVIKKRCNEKGLSDKECEQKIKEYKIKKYKDNRYVEPDIRSQKHD